MGALRKIPVPWAAGSVGALLLGLLAGPVAVYWAGGRVVGEYADVGGLLALWASIYSDAARLGPAGLSFLLGPLLMFQVVWAALLVWKKYVR